MESKNFLAKLNAVLECNPENCQKAGCPLYYEEASCCDAGRFISALEAELRIKYENTKLYSYFDE